MNKKNNWRGIVLTTLAITVIFVLAACGGTTAQPTAAPPTDASQANATGKDYCKDNEGQLIVYNWPEYLARETVERFSQACNVQVIEDFYPSNEDLLAKVTAGGTGYDVVAPTGYAVELLREKDALLKLDHSALPNFKYMGAQFAKGRPHDPDSEYSVTKNWGTFGIMWNSEKVSEEITSWADLWQLAPKYSGKIIFVDSSPDVLGAALKAIGASWNSADKAELDKALAKLLEIKPHIRSFDTNYFGRLANDEVYIVVGYNGDAFNVNAQRAEAGKTESIKYVVPSEGSNIWEDAWAILKDAPHPKAAHAFLNFLMDPEIQGIETNYTHYASGSPNADKFIQADVRSNPAVYPPDEIIAKLEATINPSADILQYREELWTKLKGS